MNRFCWSAIASLVSAIVLGATFVEAKDQHHRVEHKAPPKVEHRPPAAASSQSHQKHSQPPAQRAPAAVNPPQSAAPVHRANVEVRNHVPKAVHNIQLMQGGQNNRPNGERHKVQLPHETPKVLVTQKDQNPPRKHDLPKVDSKIQLPQINQNGPRHQDERNKIPQHQPKLNPPNITIPGTGQGNPSAPGGQPKFNLPQHGHRGGQNPSSGYNPPNPANNTLPQFNPNVGNNNNPNFPKLDSKHVLENRRDNKLPGGLNLNPQLPGNGGLNLDANRTEKGREPGRHFGRDHLPMKGRYPNRW